MPLRSASRFTTDTCGSSPAALVLALFMASHAAGIYAERFSKHCDMPQIAMRKGTY